MTAARPAPAPIPEHRSLAGRCWRCNRPLTWRVLSDGRLLEECPHCIVEWDSLLAELNTLRRLAGPRVAHHLQLATQPVDAVAPAEPEVPVRRRCSCGRLLRRRRNGSAKGQCYFCEHGRE